MAFIAAPLGTKFSSRKSNTLHSFPRPSTPLPNRSRLSLSLSKSDTVNAPKRRRAPSPSPQVSSNLPPSNSQARFVSNLAKVSQKTQWDHLLATALGEQPINQLWFHTDDSLSTVVLPRVPRRKRVDTTPSTPVRKPHGFWNDVANVERELLVVNAQLGRPGKKIIPRLSEMAQLGRGDLVAAISKHGGVKKLAETLRWGRGGKSRRALGVDTPSDVNVGAKTNRQKMMRRPKSYWDNVERVKCEIGAFIDEYGVKGVMPTQKQFYTFQRADLVQAASRHGGLRLMAKMMGLTCRRAPKKKLYWKDFDVLKKALLQFSDRHCPGRMPTGEELRAYGASAITNAIAAHGGFPAVAKKCELEARNTKSQGAPVTWDKERLRTELHTFTLTYLPELASTNTIPTERQLRMYGRNDLSYAINKFGGFGKVAKMLGLNKKRQGVYSSKQGLER